MEHSVQEEKILEKIREPLDSRLLKGYLFLAMLLWIAVFYVTGSKWWNHPLTFLAK